MTETETEPDASSRTDVVLDRLAYWSPVWAFLAIIYGVLGLLGVLPFPQITAEVRVFVVMGLGVSVLFAPSVAWGLDKIFTVPKHIIVALDSAKGDEDCPVSIYEGGRKLYEEEFECVEGSVRSFPLGGDVMHIVETFDPETGEAVSTWHGESTPVELMTHRGAVKANRGKLRRMAEFGSRALASLPAMSIAMEQEAWRAVSSASLDKTAYEPESMRATLRGVVDDESGEWFGSDSAESVEDVAEERAGGGDSRRPTRADNAGAGEPGKTSESGKTEVNADD